MAPPCAPPLRNTIHSPSYHGWVAGPLLWRICEFRLVAVPRGPGTRIERPFCPTGLRACGPIRGHSDKAKLGSFTRGGRAKRGVGEIARWQERRGGD